LGLGGHYKRHLSVICITISGPGFLDKGGTQFVLLLTSGQAIATSNKWNIVTITISGFISSQEQDKISDLMLVYMDFMM